jgi:hypothetical protein
VVEGDLRRHKIAAFSIAGSMLKVKLMWEKADTHRLLSEEKADTQRFLSTRKSGHPTISF